MALCSHILPIAESSDRKWHYPPMQFEYPMNTATIAEQSNPMRREHE